MRSRGKYPCAGERHHRLQPAMAKWRRPRRSRVLAIRDRLRELYGRPVNHPHGQPIAELVLTVLSQNTNDRNRDVAYERLRARFPTWVEVRDAPVEEVEEAIRPGGLAQVEVAADPGDAARARRPSRRSTGSRRAPRDEARDFLVRRCPASAARPRPA